MGAETPSRGMALRAFVTTVRFRTTAIATAVVAIVLVGTAIVLLVAQRRALLANLDTTLELRADDVSRLVETGAVPEVLATDSGEEAVVQVVTDQGAVVAASANLSGEAPIVDPPEAEDQFRELEALPVDDERFRVLSRRVDGPGGPFVVHVASTLEEVSEPVESLTAVLVAVLPAVLVVVAVLIWLAVGRALRPVETMRREVSVITANELHRRVAEPETADEIGRLAQTMNGMLDRIEAAHEQQRRFVADASHELRSPLTNMRSELEVDLAHRDGADLEATHRSVLEETSRLQRLVDDLLQLARTDAGVGRWRDVDVDLDEIVLAEAARLRRVGDVQVDASEVSGAQVRGDPDALARAIRNVIENAQRHASGRVELSLDETDHRVELVVADDGPGIPAADRERVFERFTRLDEARGRTDGGTGLGLAITRDIVRAHGGAISVDPSASVGARIVIVFGEAT